MYLYTLFFVIAATLVAGPGLAAEKMVIAAKGAGRDLLDHSLPALTLAVAKGAEYLELQVTMTADGALIVFGDPTFTHRTDIAEVFPERQRDDGDYHVVDFALAEVRQLRLRNSPLATAKTDLSLPIATLEETLALLSHLENRVNRRVGMVIEIITPGLHRAAGKDISTAVLECLVHFGYHDPASRIFLQSTDPDELQRIHEQLMPQYNLDLPLIQRLGGAPPLTEAELSIYRPNDWLLTNSGLRVLASYAWGLVVPNARLNTEDPNQSLADYFAEAGRYGLQRLVITSAVASTEEPLGNREVASLAELDTIFGRHQADGVYTNSYLDVHHYLQKQEDDARRQLDLPPFFSELELKRPAPQDNNEQGRISPFPGRQEENRTTTRQDLAIPPSND
ncbi:MAG: glycerophosphodiester phosphodiesterase family protein [Desulforhopalus sp.]|nr:glycerophosphodiester phosphodiesterase family protein [Desulforhopalus sp.]